MNNSEGQTQETVKIFIADFAMKVLREKYSLDKEEFELMLRRKHGNFWNDYYRENEEKYIASLKQYPATWLTPEMDGREMIKYVDFEVDPYFNNAYPLKTVATTQGPVGGMKWVKGSDRLPEQGKVHQKYSINEEFLDALEEVIGRKAGMAEYFMQHNYRRLYEMYEIMYSRCIGIRQRYYEQKESAPLYENPMVLDELLDSLDVIKTFNKSLPVTGESEAIGFAEWMGKGFEMIIDGSWECFSEEYCEKYNLQLDEHYTTSGLLSTYKQSKK